MSADFNWVHLADVVEPKRDNRLSWEEAQGRFRKVAWDVYKPTDGTESLWELRDGEDGKKYLFAMYDTATPAAEPVAEPITTTSSDWVAICDRDRKNVTLSFKGFPLKRFSSQEFGFKPEDAERFAAFVQEKTAQPEFVKQVIKGLPLQTAGVVSQLRTNSEE